MAGLAVLVSWAILKGSHHFFHTFSMALYHKWDVKNAFTFVLQFFSLISDSLGGVHCLTYFPCDDLEPGGCLNLGENWRCSKYYYLHIDFMICNVWKLCYFWIKMCLFWLTVVCDSTKKLIFWIDDFFVAIVHSILFFSCLLAVIIISWKKIKQCDFNTSPKNGAYS